VGATQQSWEDRRERRKLRSTHDCWDSLSPTRKSFTHPAMIIPSPTIKPEPEVQAGCWSGFKRSIRKKKSTPRSKLPPGGLTADHNGAQPQLVCTRPRCVKMDPNFRRTRSPNTPTPPHATSAGTETAIVPWTGGRRTNPPHIRPWVETRSSARM